MYGLTYIDGEAYAYNGVGTPTASELVPGSDGNCYTDTGALCAQSSGWQKAYADASGYPVPISVGASESTSDGDYTWYNAGKMISIVGGSFADGSNDGLFCLGRNSAWGNAYSNLGARLSFER